MNKAILFNIQKFCVHDGPGIRTTVFFKGCPLSCIWCHNPESQDFKQEIFFNQEKCCQCGSCAEICPVGAIQLKGGAVFMDAENCSACGTCTDFCVNNARELTGEYYALKDLMVEIEKDKPFYEQSKGGVTISGGEALCQIDYVLELVKLCKKKGISVAIDTCGYVPFGSFEKILDYVDVFLYDIKVMDSALHVKYTGKDNRLILDNLRKLHDKGAKLQLRLPLIEGINTSDENINQTIDFIRGMNISLINLLPYHDIGSAKYSRLNKVYPYELLARPSEERLAQIKNLFEANNFKVKIGG